MTRAAGSILMGLVGAAAVWAGLSWLFPGANGGVWAESMVRVMAIGGLAAITVGAWILWQAIGRCVDPPECVGRLVDAFCLIMLGGLGLTALLTILLDSRL